MKPAMTAEEWNAIRHIFVDMHFQSMPTGQPQHGFRSPSDWEKRIERLRTTVTEQDDGDRHAIAAFALYGQDFGFTREDIGVIHMLARQHHPTCRCDYCVTLKPKAESLMARIEALLPIE